MLNVYNQNKNPFKMKQSENKNYDHLIFCKQLESKANEISQKAEPEREKNNKRGDIGTQSTSFKSNCRNS